MKTIPILPELKLKLKLIYDLWKPEGWFCLLQCITVVVTAGYITVQLVSPVCPVCRLYEYFVEVLKYRIYCPSLTSAWVVDRWNNAPDVFLLTCLSVCLSVCMFAYVGGAEHVLWRQQLFAVLCGHSSLFIYRLTVWCYLYYHIVRPIVSQVRWSKKARQGVYCAYCNESGCKIQHGRWMCYFLAYSSSLLRWDHKGPLNNTNTIAIMSRHNAIKQTQ